MEKFLYKVKDLDKNEKHKGANYIVGVRYGTEGIAPCHKSNDCISCVTSSGDCYCGWYNGHVEIEIENKKLYIVRCIGEVRCSS